MPDDLSISYENVIPTNVRRQAKRAEEMIQEQLDHTSQDPADSGAAPPEPSAEGTTVVQPVNEPEHPAPAPAPPADNWEQRYRTIQGKYDAEVPSLHGELRALRRQVETMQETQHQAPPAPTMPAPAPAVPAADVEVYGEELVSGARRWARAEMSPELETMRAQLTEQQRRLEELQGQTSTVASNELERTLDSQVQNWREINGDPAFISWVNQVDPFSGTTRLSLANAALKAHDGMRVASFFRAFTAEQTATQPSGQSAQTTHGVAAPMRLEDMAAPGRVMSGPSNGAPPSRRMWTHAQIAAFYSDRLRGKYRGREKVADDLERDIVSANSEGRIRN